jgi:undecaprenyl diphosphate synthase
MNKSMTSPAHIAIIMDGNGRWAKKRFMPRTVGHVKGASLVPDLVKACLHKGIRHLTLFAFSTENWSRPDDEVSTLMGLFIQYLEKEIQNMQAEGVRLNIIGDTSRFAPALQDSIHKATSSTVGNTRLILNVAANYGGRWDILQAVQAWQVANPTASVADLEPEQLNDYLSTAGQPEPDLLIRTGGESRISNFMMWQLAYAEFYFTDILWPDFDAEEFEKALVWFEGRERRFGSVVA